MRTHDHITVSAREQRCGYITRVPKDCDHFPSLFRLFVDCSEGSYLVSQSIPHHSEPSDQVDWVVWVENWLMPLGINQFSTHTTQST